MGAKQGAQRDQLRPAVGGHHPARSVALPDQSEKSVGPDRDAHPAAFGAKELRGQDGEPLHVDEVCRKVSFINDISTFFVYRELNLFLLTTFTNLCFNSHVDLDTLTETN